MALHYGRTIYIEYLAPDATVNSDVENQTTCYKINIYVIVHFRNQRRFVPEEVNYSVAGTQGAMVNHIIKKVENPLDTIQQFSQ